MAAQSIGVLYSTKIPGYADNADVQAAFKLYHYGSTDYNIANANTANLVNPSIAYTLNYLQGQITGLDPTGSVLKSIIDAKGDLLIGLSNDNVDNLGVGSNGHILTADSAQTLGIKWAAPAVTETNSITFTNKTLTSPVLGGITSTASGNLVIGAAAYIVEVRGGASTDGAIQLNCSANTHGQKIKAQTHAQAASNTLLLPGGTTIGNSDAVLVSNTGTQILTNKSISLTTNTITGTKAEFNSAMSDADFASLAGSETLTNKTISYNSNTFDGVASEIMVLMGAL